MVFTSITFIVFFIVLLAIYYSIPKSYRWVWLLIGSYVFYLFSTPVFVFFLLFSTATTWYFPLLIGKNIERQDAYLASDAGKGFSKEQKKEYKGNTARSNRRLLVACLMCNIGLLAVLKYTNFAIGIVNLFGMGLNTVDWLIFPLGISFYTFQSVGYCIDVYRQTVKPQQNFFKHALFVCFFPQICMGPIGRYEKLSPQLYAGHSFDYDRFTYGLTRMLLGFFKKLVIANRLSMVVDYFYADVGSYSGLALAYATLLYALQLYADFSGYIDIAIGAGNCVGIRLDENFKQPYFSRSITEYWRRWHITLGSWFKDYLFYSVLRSDWCAKIGKSISQKGHKKLAKTLTTVIGLFITWLLVGLWHGASMRFVFHGLYHGSFIILATACTGGYEKAKKALHINDDNKLWRLFQIIRTNAIVCFGYVLFRSDSFYDATAVYRSFFTKMVTSYSEMFKELRNGVLILPPIQYIILFVGVLFLFLMELYSFKSGSFTKWFNSRKTAFRWSCIYITLLAVIFLGTTGSANSSSFIYFQF